MIEILVIISFVRKLAAIAESKGRAKTWAALGVVGWIGGELMGAFVGALMGMQGAGIYVCALAAAAVGAGIAYFIVKNLGEGGMVAAYGASSTGAENPNYDPQNPYSPPKRE